MLNKGRNGEYRMKKFFSTIIAFVILLSCTYVQAATFTDVDEEYINAIAGLGIMNGYDDGTFLPDTPMTRAEFAQLISNLFFKDEAEDNSWEKEYMGNSNENELITDVNDEEAKQIFSDVSDSHWAYNAIMNVYSLGYMNGVTKDEFDTESSVTTDQVYKVMVTILGYKPQAYVKGGYPNGYRRVANELKITNGVSAGGEAKRGDVARIIYNCFDVEMQYLTTVGDKMDYTKNGKTFLNDILDCYYIDGRMTDNGIVSFIGNSADTNSVVVSNLKIKLTDETDYIREYIGRDVAVYYKKDGDIREAVYASLTEKDETIVIPARDFLSYSDETIVYEEKETQKRASVKNSNVIKNGEILTVYSEEDFKMNNGFITLIKPKNSNNCDLIVVEAYTSFYVDSVDKETKKVYSKDSLLNKKYIDFSSEDKNYYIYDSLQSRTDFSAITSGVILSVCESENVVKIKISDKKLSNWTASSKGTEDGRIYLQKEEEKYYLSKDFLDMYDESTIEAGTAYVFYLDAFNEIVKAEKSDTSGIKVGFYLDMKQDNGLDGEWQIKYFSEDGVMEVSAFGSKVLVKNENDVEKTYRKFEDVKTMLDNYTGLFRYSVNDQNEMTYVELAAKRKDRGQNQKNRLVMIELEKDQPLGTFVSSYYKLTQGFLGIAIIDSSSNTKVFKYDDTNPDNDDGYAIYDRYIFQNDGTYDVCCYSLNGDAQQADFVLYASGEEKKIDAMDKTLAIVKSVTKGLDGNGEPANIVKAYVDGAVTETVFYCEDSVLSNVVNHRQETSSSYEASSSYKIEVGDIIRYDLNTDGTLKRIYLMWDENMQNPHYAGTNQQGHIPGTIGYFDKTLDTAKNGATMPFAYYNYLNDDGSSKYNSNAELWKTGHMRIYSAIPMYSDASHVTLTTQDITVSNYLPYDSRYITETFSYTVNVPVYTIKNNTLSASLVPVSSLRTYELYGDDCDRGFFMTRVGQILANVYVRGYTGR